MWLKICTVDLTNICSGTHKDKKRNTPDTLSKLLTCVLLYYGRSRAVDESFLFKIYI